MNTHIHTFACACACAGMRACVHACVRACVRVHTQVCMYVHACMYAYMHMNVCEHAGGCTCARACVCACTYAGMHVHTSSRSLLLGHEPSLLHLPEPLLMALSPRHRHELSGEMPCVERPCRFWIRWVRAWLRIDQGIGDLGDSGPVRASVDIVIPTPLEPGSHLGRSPPGQLGLHPHLIWCQVWPLVQLLIAAFMLLLDLHLLL